ncbi:hypothetical protein Naga_101893g2 [Nannochloropsis gaditana]|uniref:Uncharacterized protein n=1 Tax=Nannochloropsis gaditana TaxID=72520 RepID=W7TI31_9STRA|nr:hypothetical protein Naga_101893g2 [Nannochloropsis gaditana]
MWLVAACASREGRTRWRLFPVGWGVPHSTAGPLRNSMEQLAAPPHKNSTSLAVTLVCTTSISLRDWHAMAMHSHHTWSKSVYGQDGCGFSRRGRRLSSVTPDRQLP